MEEYIEQVAVSCVLAAEWMASYGLRHAHIFTGADSVESACVHMASCYRKGDWEDLGICRNKHHDHVYVSQSE